VVHGEGYRFGAHLRFSYETHCLRMLLNSAIASALFNPYGSPSALLLIRSIRHGMDEMNSAMSLLPSLAGRPRAQDQNSRDAYPTLLHRSDRGRPRLAGPAASFGTDEHFLSPTLASWAKSRRLVFLREQDRENAPRHGRISRIGRAPFELRVVAVDLPEDRLAGVLEAAEVVLAIGIISLFEFLEGTHALGNRGLRILRQSTDAARNEDLPADERSPEGVVLFRNGHKSEMVKADKVDLSRSAAPERSPVAAGDQARGQGLVP
jgi:hypothetical protein